jgi:DNA repair exonuclease SbcCD ATPase subunit
VEYYRHTPEARTCPVCEREVSETFASELERRLGAGITEAERTLRAELDEVVSRMDELDGRLADLERLAAAARAARERLSLERRSLEQALGRAVAEDEDPAAVTAIETEKAEADLRKLRETVEAWMEDLSRIEAEGRKMEPVSRLLELEARMNTLGDLRHAPEWKLMVERRRFLSRQEQNLRLLMETTRGLATAIAENNLKRVTEPISEIFRALTRRSDFPSVLVDPVKKYEVSLAGDGVTLAPTAILNLTDLNALAIGVIAGMATAFEEATDLGFLILDDPSQGMDEAVTRRLGDVLSRLSARVQIVVATPDPVLAAVLRRSPRRKNIIRLAPRDPDSRQPSVRVESVSH